jgi:hypothetical protein
MQLGLVLLEQLQLEVYFGIIALAVWLVLPMQPLQAQVVAQ